MSLPSAAIDNREVNSPRNQGLQARFRHHLGDFLLEVTLDLPATGVTALFGPSGSGKTTLLRCLAGLDHPDEARLTVNGDDWHTSAFRLPVHRRPVGYVFQEASLFPHLTVQGNLRYGYDRVAASQRQVDFDETVALLGVTELLARYPDQLSGGQRQRVAIARALLTSPRLLLMDEPMAALDSASKAEILPYLERLHATLAIPVIYVSHNLEEVARLADHLVLLEQGKVVADGPLTDLLVRPDLPLAHQDSAFALVAAEIIQHDETHHLTELAGELGSLWVSRIDAAPGESVRLNVRARDVVIALAPPLGVSLLNCLVVEVDALFDDPNPGHVLVHLRQGKQVILARITRRSAGLLKLHPGQTVYALIKAVTLK